MQKTQTNEYTIDLVELGKTLLRNKWGILQIAFVCGVIAVLIALFFVTPQYEANASFYVNNSVAATQNSASSINNADLTAAHTLVNTYGVILKSRMVLTEIIDKAGLSYTPGELGRMITAHAINDTEVMSVVVKSSSPSEAERIANTIMEILPEKIADVVTGSSVKVVDYAVVPTSKSSPSVKKYAAIGILLGLIGSCGVFCLLDILDDVIKNPSYLKQNFDEPVLAFIPDMQKEETGVRYAYTQTASRSRKAGA